ncbi:MAG: LysM peptidoglycan-binding domain-containing protein [Planctomycetes bacterium]|nr:LysM peptidoglycan-binding domain-containing protein [Planctomycetota bacterium]
MTREQKLALIVGFSLTLLVGILLTDHLSQGRVARVDGVAEREGTLRTLAGAVPQSAYAISSADNPAPAQVEPAPATHDAPAPPATTQRVAFTQDPLTRILDADLEAIQQPSASTAQAEPQQTAVPSILEVAASHGVELVPVQQHTTQPTIIDPLAPTPDPAWYTVQPNDNLYKLCERFYGTGTVWPKLAAHNTSRVKQNGWIRAGVRLQIPHPSVVLGPGATFASPLFEPDDPAPSQTAPTPTEPDRKLRKYQIQPGDCLSLIAQNELGTIRRQGEILALNKDRLHDADDVRSGMVILLPAG